jgi:hypothetical protein
LFAQIETGLGIKSIWFVLLRSDFYNAFSPASVRILRALIDMGHRIGLHYDETVFTGGRHIENIQREAALLSGVLDTEIKAVSMHIPSKSALEEDWVIEGMANSYSKKFSREFNNGFNDALAREPGGNDLVRGIRKTARADTSTLVWGRPPGSIRNRLQDFISLARTERYDLLTATVRDLPGIIGKDEISA